MLLHFFLVKKYAVTEVLQLNAQHDIGNLILPSPRTFMIVVLQCFHCWFSYILDYNDDFRF